MVHILPLSVSARGVVLSEGTACCLLGGRHDINQRVGRIELVLMGVWCVAVIAPPVIRWQ